MPLVLGIGNAIVDIISQVTDAELGELGLRKGGMTLIEGGMAEKLSRRPPIRLKSGGSVANTMAIMGLTGSKVAFIGRIADDPFGQIFAEDLTRDGVSFCRIDGMATPMTARSFVMVTPDAQRTMATFLGEAGQLSEDRLPTEKIADADYLFLEGYLWDQGTTTAALRKAIAAAKAAGTQIAFTVSDGFCVERHRGDFMRLLEETVDVLFANEQELLHLFEVEAFDEALIKLLEKTASRPRLIVAVTRSAQGAIVVQGHQVEVVPTEPVADLVDTTGAGDAFAAGFLQGLCSGDSLANSAKRGHWYAGQIVQVVGARSDTLRPYATDAALSGRR